MHYELVNLFLKIYLANNVLAGAGGQMNKKKTNNEKKGLGIVAKSGVEPSCLNTYVLMGMMAHELF